MPTAKELLETRASLAAKIKEMADRQAEWKAEDQANWEKLNKDYDATKRQYDILKRSEEIGQEIGTPAGDLAIGRSDTNHSHTPKGLRKKEVPTEEERAMSLQAWCRAQSGLPLSKRHKDAAAKCGVNPGRRHLDMSLTKDYRNVRAAHSKESRALSVGVDSAGGYTAPTGFIPSLERALLSFAHVRDVANVIRTDNGNELPWPSVNDTTVKGELLTENQQVGEHDVTFGASILRAYKFSSKLVRVSAELLSDSAFDLATMLGSLLGERLGRAQADYFTTGSGAACPRGFVTAATLGITAASETAILADETLKLVHSIDPAYRTMGCSWSFHDQTLLALRLLKDGIGRYLWQAGISGAPDTFWNYPININQSMATPAAGSIPIVFGVFSKFAIRDVGMVRLRRLVERYADQDQEGFVAFMRSDSTLIDAGTHPLKYLQMAA